MKGKPLSKYVSPLFYIVIIIGSAFLYYRFVFLGYFQFGSSLLAGLLAIVCGLLTGILVYLLVSGPTKEDLKNSRNQTRDKVGNAIVSVVTYVVVLFVIGGLCGLIDKYYGLYRVRSSLKTELQAELGSVCAESSSDISKQEAHGPLGVIAIYGEEPIIDYSGSGSQYEDTLRLEIELKDKYTIASSVEELNTVICFTVQRNPGPYTCTYEGGSTVKVHSQKLQIQVVDWKTHEVRAEKIFASPVPGPSHCPEQIRIENGQRRTPFDVYTDWSALGGQIKDWLAEIEEIE